MKLVNRGLPILILLLVVGWGLYGMECGFFFSGSQETPNIPQQTENQPEEEIHSGPKDIKEKIAIYVFLGWLWISILVMVYFLRQKIKESDRLWAYQYYSLQNEEKDSK